jgi:hypothetical protein
MAKRNPRGYWTKERVLEDARRFPYQAKWIKGSPTSYSIAKKNGWVKEACAHMISPKVPLGHWTLENLIADALKYRTRADWKRGNQSAYATACQMELLEPCCAHMERDRKPDGYWTKERVIESSIRYRTIAEWSLAESGAYDAAKSNGWMEDATRHMVRIYSHGEYTIYTLLLQYDIKFVYQKRFDDLRHKYQLPIDFYLPAFDLAIEFHGRQHFAVSKSSMFRKDFVAMQKRDAIKRCYAKDKGIEFLEIVSPVVDEIEGILIERLTGIAARRQIQLVLNKRELTKAELDALASLNVWTKGAVLKDALVYQTIRDWRNNDNAAYQIALKNGWLEEATGHMIRLQKPSGYWTKERVITDALRFTTKIEWIRDNKNAWAAAQRNGWLAEIGALLKARRLK